MTPNQTRLLDAIERFPNSSATKLSLELGLGQGYLQRELSFLVRTGKALRHDNLYRVPCMNELVPTITEQPQPIAIAVPKPQPQPQPIPTTQEITPVSKHKECRRCHHSKPLDEFGEDSRTPDGKAHLCKACRIVGGKARAKQTDLPKSAKPSQRVKTIKDIVTRHAANKAPVTRFDARAVLLDELRERHTAIGVAIAAIESLPA